MLTLTDLNECFNRAKEMNSRYMAVRINIGLSRSEIIINPYDNFVQKQAYYNHAYGEDLRHKFAGDEDIRITGYTHGDSFAEIESMIDFYDAVGSNLLN